MLKIQGSGIHHESAHKRLVSELSCTAQIQWHTDSNPNPAPNKEWTAFVHQTLPKSLHLPLQMISWQKTGWLQWGTQNISWGLAQLLVHWSWWQDSHSSQSDPTQDVTAAHKPEQTGNSLSAHCTVLETHWGFHKSFYPLQQLKGDLKLPWG